MAPIKTYEGDEGRQKVKRQIENLFKHFLEEKR